MGSMMNEIAAGAVVVFLLVCVFGGLGLIMQLKNPLIDAIVLVSVVGFCIFHIYGCYKQEVP